MTALDDYTTPSLERLTDEQVKDEYAAQMLWLAKNAQMVGLVGVEMGKLAALEMETEKRKAKKAGAA